MRQEKLEFLSLWAINNDMELPRMLQQLERLKKRGIQGVVLRLRHYTNVPAFLSDQYMDIVNQVILRAKELDLSFWLYVENTLTRQILMEEHPELTCQWLEFHDGQVEVKTKHAVNSLSLSDTRLLIHYAMDKYATMLDEDAFEYVAGFFSDEVGFIDSKEKSTCRECGGIPWYQEMPARYAAATGGEIREMLHLLFEDGEGAGPFRIWYWENLSDLLAEHYYKPLQRWCTNHGKLFAAHVKGEENPLFSLSYCGSVFNILRHVAVPGMDCCGRVPGNHYYPRIMSSLSAQFSNGESIAESLVGGGYGMTPGDFERYMLWLKSHGITKALIHSHMYTFSADGIRDWPASVPTHMLWRDVTPSLIEDINHINTRIKDGVTSLLICPTRGVMANFTPDQLAQMNEYNGENVSDSEAARISNSVVEICDELYNFKAQFHLSDEKLVEECGSVRDGVLTIGKECYTRLVVSDDLVWTEKGKDLLDRFVKGGGQVVSYEDYKVVKGQDYLVHYTSPNAALYQLNNAIDLEQQDWQFAPPIENKLLLQWKVNGDTLECPIAVEELTDDMFPMTLSISDKVTGAYFNGAKLESQRRNRNGFDIYPITREMFVPGKQQLVKVDVSDCKEKQPFAFFNGRFLVKSRVGYTQFGKRAYTQLKTKYDFYLTPYSSFQGGNLLEAGFPFVSKPITATKQFKVHTDLDHAQIHLTDIAADAAKVFLDNEFIGYTWGTRWSIPVEHLSANQEHTLRLELVPNTFNLYGPHRHIDGNRLMTTPAQFLGVRNFADKPGAPEYTLTDEYKFVKFSLSGRIRIR